MTNIRVHAKKSLGQNFLVNEGVLDRIVQASEVGPRDVVVEVGPGTGALTQRLVATGARVIAIEKDHRLIEPLREKFADATNLEIIEGDILKMRLTTDDLQHPIQKESRKSDFDVVGCRWLVVSDGYKLVANIPYYLTSHLIRLMLEQWPAPSLAVLMVQEEVARRMMAAPPDMNLLALSVQLYAVPSKVMRVSRGSFRPIPDVDSAVVKLELRDSNNELREQNERILRIAKKAFGQKRKQLKATIPEATLFAVGVAPTARPQELSIDQWRKIATHYS